ncbi:MAG: class I SAM-dependent methyltransferase [Candidatus Binatia bacterium]
MRLGKAEDLADEAAFDVVTMMDLIEHVPDPAGLLAAAHRALVPGGTLVVYTPDHLAMTVRLARILSRLGVRYPVAEIFGRNHVCFFDHRTLRGILQRAGFADIDLLLRLYDPARPGQVLSPSTSPRSPPSNGWDARSARASACWPGPMPASRAPRRGRRLFLKTNRRLG